MVIEKVFKIARFLIKVVQRFWSWRVLFHSIMGIVAGILCRLYLWWTKKIAY